MVRDQLVDEERRSGGAADVIPDSTRALLTEAGRTYTPFKYQGKCLEWIRARDAALADADRQRIDSVLDGTGCGRLVVDTS